MPTLQELYQFNLYLMRVGNAIDSLRTKAASILAQLAPLDTAETQRLQGKKDKKSQNSDSERNLSKNLFEAYGNTEDNLTHDIKGFPKN